MRNMTIWHSVGQALAGATLCLALPAAAQPPAPQMPFAVAERATALRGPVPAPTEIVTRHVIAGPRGKLAFTAQAGEILLRDDSGNPTAALFSFSYLQDVPPDTPPRPVVFVMGGGPGSASSFLHIGLLGPWTVPLSRVDPTGPRRGSALPPYGLEANPDTLLEVADLVFIDPVGTGFSRAVGDGRDADFWGMDADNEANAQFIAAWLTKHGRWDAPKFFLGESYGSIRASIISNALMGGPYTNGQLRGVALNGVMLLATVFDMGPLRGDPVLATALNLPVQAATAWYHGTIDRRGRGIAEFDAEVRAFATGPYLDALRQDAKGTLSAAVRGETVRQLVACTGLSAERFAKTLALPPDEFTRAIFADRGQMVGMYDGRYTLPIRSGPTDPVGDDPALGRLFVIWTAAMEKLLHDKLKVSPGRPYMQIMWRNLLPGWSLTRRGVPPGQNFADDLANTLRRSPGTRAFVSSGYYDFVTPAATAREAIRLAGVPAGQVEFHSYEGGHDIYASPVGSALAADLRSFVVRTVEQAER